MNTPQHLRINFASMETRQPQPDPEDATMGRLSIYAGPIILTRMKPSRSGPIVSSLPLAEWLAANWWRLANEPRPQDEPELDWWQSHCIIEAGQGFVWPNITLWAEDGHMLVRSKPTSEPSHALYTGANRGAPIPITTQSFQESATRLITQTIDRLNSAGINGTNLHVLFEDLKAELADPNLAGQRRAEAIAGQDPPYQGN